MAIEIGLSRPPEDLRQPAAVIVMVAAQDNGVGLARVDSESFGIAEECLSLAGVEQDLPARPVIAPCPK